MGDGSRESCFGSAGGWSLGLLLLRPKLRCGRGANNIFAFYDWSTFIANSLQRWRSRSGVKSLAYVAEKLLDPGGIVLVASLEGLQRLSYIVRLLLRPIQITIFLAENVKSVLDRVLAPPRKKEGDVPPLVAQLEMCLEQYRIFAFLPRVPTCVCSLEADFRISGLRWFLHLSRHCFPVRSVLFPMRLSWSAIRVQACLPPAITSRRSSSSSLFPHGVFLTNLVWSCAHL